MALVKNVLVLGGSYSGSHAAEVLAKTLPPNHRVLLIDRNSHFNHLYSFPRFGVVPGHEHKAFIPYTGLLHAPAVSGPAPSGSSTSSSDPARSRQSSASPGPTDDTHSTATASPEDTLTSSVASLAISNASTNDGDAAASTSGSASYSNSIFTHSTANSSSTSLASDVQDSSYPARSVFVQASVTKIGDGWVEVDRKLDLAGLARERSEKQAAGRTVAGEDVQEELGVTVDGGSKGSRIDFDYLIYALGSTLPAPILSNAHSKAGGVAFLRDQQSRIASARSVIIIGAGPLGIQYACDIADYYGTRPSGCPSDSSCHCSPAQQGIRSGRGEPKTVTLIASRRRLLPLFKEELSQEAKKRLRELGVEVIWEDRVQKGGVRQLQEGDSRGRRRWGVKGRGDGMQATEEDVWSVELESGRRLKGDCVLMCTGQRPHSDLMATLHPDSVSDRGYVRVDDALRVTVDPSSSSPIPTSVREGRVFAIGDCVDNGAIKAGHTGWNMGDLTARNIQKLVDHDDLLSSSSCRPSELPAAPELELYKPSLPMIKLTLGLTRSISQLVASDDPTRLDITVHHDNPVDMNWKGLWQRLGVEEHDPHL